jgi:dienelactone hydrolase
MRLQRTTLIASAAFLFVLVAVDSGQAADAVDTPRGDRMIADYFRSETQKLTDASLADIKTWRDWTNQREKYRQQLREMLGLDPLPERTPLDAIVTGRLDRDDFKVEKLYFQSRPHLYVTGNLYLPKKQTGRVPAILYVCGHSGVKKDGVSFGSKAHYQHYGAWFAQNGYVCLIIDTLQLGEIEGLHHGTYRENMWWWNARGYTPAGVETWNSIRAIDYLVSRPEVDRERIGMTGRSGGGAYSWYAAALDDRIKAAVPVAGITNLRDHVVENCVEGHCDCMYMVNTYRWDYPQLAALLAPRPLLISNTDRDEHFPFDGVVDVYKKVRRLYELDRKGADVALQMAAGPHEDLQVLQLYALQWFDQHLKGENRRIETAAKDYFKPEELKVFDKLPADQINTRIPEAFVPQATAPAPPATKAEWEAQRDKWMTVLREKCFRGWPAESKDRAALPRARLIFESVVDDAQFSAYDFDSQDNVTLRLYLLLPNSVPRNKLRGIMLWPQNDADWTNILLVLRSKLADQLVDEGAIPEIKGLPGVEADLQNGQVMFQELWAQNRGWVFFAPRGIGRTAWTSDPTKRTHIRRRFMLLGQTLDGMRVWDVRRAIQSVRTIDGLANVPLTLNAGHDMAAIALYAALFEPRVDSLELNNMPKSHRAGPDFLNVLRFLDMPQTVAMVAEKSHVIIYDDESSNWEYPLAVAKKIDWKNRITIRATSTDNDPAKDARSK